MQEAVLPEQKSITVFYSLNCYPPLPDLKAWILVYVSFNDPSHYTASAHVKDSQLNFGHIVAEADGKTPYEALEALRHTIDDPEQDRMMVRENRDLINTAIEQKQIFTPTFSLNDIQEQYEPLPVPALIFKNTHAILTHESLVPAELAAEVAGVSTKTIQSWQDSGKLQPAYVNSNHIMFRVRDMFGAVKA